MFMGLDRPCNLLCVLHMDGGKPVAPGYGSSVQKRIRDLLSFQLESWPLFSQWKHRREEGIQHYTNLSFKHSQLFLQQQFSPEFCKLFCPAIFPLPPKRLFPFTDFLVAEVLAVLSRKIVMVDKPEVSSWRLF